MTAIADLSAAPRAAPSPLGLLLGWEAGARRQGSVAELAWFLANDTDPIVACDQLFILKRPLVGQGWQVQAASSLVAVERNAPLIRAIEAAARSLDADPCDLDAPADEALAEYPFRHWYWQPLLDRDGAAFAGLLLARAHPFERLEADRLVRLAETAQHAWLALTGGRPARRPAYAHAPPAPADRRRRGRRRVVPGPYVGARAGRGGRRTPGGHHRAAGGRGRGGRRDDTRTEVQKILECDDIPDAFPADVLAAGESAPQEVPAADLQDRVDLRHLPMLTIDPETARDFDDAVCLEPGPTPHTTRLWVAVADVSHYVRGGTALDREAEAPRGLGVPARRAIPMLPHQLSSGICSLNPEVDRAGHGRPPGYQPQRGGGRGAVHGAVIRSHARLDYGGVAAALAGDLRGVRARYEPYLPTLADMMELAGRLRKVRQSRGSLDFDLPEAQVVLDEDDPRRVRTVRRSRADPAVKQAYMMVEDFMLAANEAAARFFSSRQLGTLWRIHAPPRLEAWSAWPSWPARLPSTSIPRRRSRPRRCVSFCCRCAASLSSDPCRSSCCGRSSRRRMPPITSATSGWRPLSTCTSLRRSGATPTSSSIA